MITKNSECVGTHQVTSLHYQISTLIATVRASDAKTDTDANRHHFRNSRTLRQALTLTYNIFATIGLFSVLYWTLTNTDVTQQSSWRQFCTGSFLRPLSHKQLGLQLTQGLIILLVMNLLLQGKYISN